MRKFLFVILVCAGAGFFLFKKRGGSDSGIEVGPASINSANVIVYTGPHAKAQKLWKLHQKNWPIYVLEISKNWVRIVDAYNTSGWMRKIYVGNPYVLILEDLEFADSHGKIEVKILKNSLVRLAKLPVIADGNMVKISVDMHFGAKEYWVNSDKIWIGPNPLVVKS